MFDPLAPTRVGGLASPWNPPPMASAPAPPGPTAPATRLDGLSDEALAERLADGDELAFEELYGRHAAGLLSVCRHILGSRDEAEDAVQQVFMQAYRQIARGDRPERLRPWLYAAARNRCISMRRGGAEPAVALAEPSTEGLDKQVERMADVRALLRDLHRLPEDQRTALVLFELGDLSQADIAEVLHCDAARVKSLVFRARSNLLASRDARDVSCSAIRRQLSIARGGELNSGALKRHLDGCESCRLYLQQVRRQRRALGVLVPVLPTAALSGRVAEASGLGAVANGKGSRWRSATAAAATAGLVFAGGLGALSLGSDDGDKAAGAPPASEAEAQPISNARSPAPPDPPPPPAGRGGDSAPAPVFVSPSVDAYDTEGPAVQGRIDAGAPPGAGTAEATGAAVGAGGAGAGERPASGLPFTGQDLFAITAAGVLLLGLGVFLRRLTPSEEA